MKKELEPPCQSLVKDVINHMEFMTWDQEVLFSMYLIRGVFNKLRIGSEYHPLWGFVQANIDNACGLISFIEETLPNIIGTTQSEYTSAVQKLENYDKMKAEVLEYKTKLKAIKEVVE